MFYYKDIFGKIHCLEDRAFEHLLPEGCVAISELDAIAAQKPTAEQAKLAKWEEIKAERDRRKDSGFKVSGKWFHSDSDSKLQHLGNKDTARDQISAGGSMPDSLLDLETGRQIAWKTMDGSWQALTCQLAFDIVRAGKAAEFAHHAAAETHKAAMAASGDPSAYDFSLGWPDIFGG